MEVFQPIPIVPSNAPRWTGVDNDDPSSELRELGTRQLGFLPSQRCISAYTSDDTAASNVPASETITDTHDERHVIHYAPSTFPGYVYRALADENIYSSVPFVQYENRYDFPAQYYRLPGETKDARKVRITESAIQWLRALFLQCDGFVNYRTKQVGEEASKDPQPWSESMEDAFLRAIIYWPPMRRAKQKPSRPGAKLMGRNELIADFITMATCEKRDRKQVSSHIQVVRPLVECEPEVVLCVSGPPDKKNILDSKLKLELEEFEMYMRTPAQVLDCPHKTLHRYTTYQPDTGQRSAVHIRTILDLIRYYPELALFQPNRLEVGKFMAMETSISLHDPQQISFNSQVELAILFAFQGPACSNPLEPPRVACRTKIFRDGICEDPLDPKTNKSKPVWFEDVDVAPCASGTRFQYVVTNFRSTFWASMFWKLAREAQSADMLATSSLPENERLETIQSHIQAARERVSSSIRGITAVQEFKASTFNGKNSQVILTIHWSFRQARDGEPGITRKRDIIMPENIEQHLADYVELLPMKYAVNSQSKSFEPPPPFGRDLRPTISTDAFDFSQSHTPLLVSNANAVHTSGTSKLQSPISFATTSAAANSFDVTSGNVGDEAWEPRGGMIPSSTISGSESRIHHHQYANDLDFTGDCHIDLAYDNPGQHTPSHGSNDVLRDHSYNGLAEPTSTDMDIQHVNTDPSLLEPFIQASETTWGKVRTFDDEFFDAGSMPNEGATSFHIMEDMDEHTYQQMMSTSAPMAAMPPGGPTVEPHVHEEKYGNDIATHAFNEHHEHEPQGQALEHYGYEHMYHHAQHFGTSYSGEPAQYHSLPEHHQLHHQYQAYPGAASAVDMAIEHEYQAEGGVKLDMGDTQHTIQHHVPDEEMDMQEQWM